MASNFAFTPQGLARSVTVGGAAPVTVSFTIQRQADTSTIALSSGAYAATGLRLVNAGTAAVFIQMGPSVTGLSATPSISMMMLNNTVETFNIRGQNCIAFACASTFTVTLNAQPGEGL